MVSTYLWSIQENQDNILSWGKLQIWLTGVLYNYVIVVAVKEIVRICK